MANLSGFFGDKGLHGFPGEPLFKQFVSQLNPNAQAYLTTAQIRSEIARLMGEVRDRLARGMDPTDLNQALRALQEDLRRRGETVTLPNPPAPQPPAPRPPAPRPPAPPSGTELEEMRKSILEDLKKAEAAFRKNPTKENREEVNSIEKGLRIFLKRFFPEELRGRAPPRPSAERTATLLAAEMAKREKGCPTGWRKRADGTCVDPTFE